MTPNILGVGRQKLEKQNRPAISGNKQGRKFSSDLFFTATKLRPLTLSIAKRLLESVEAVAETTTKSVMLFLQNRISQRDSTNQKHSFFFFLFFICASQEFAWKSEFKQDFRRWSPSHRQIQNTSSRTAYDVREGKILKPGVGQNIAIHVSPSARNFFLVLNFTRPAHSLPSFPPKPLPTFQLR